MGYFNSKVKGKYSAARTAGQRLAGYVVYRFSRSTAPRFHTTALFALKRLSMVRAR